MGRPKFRRIDDHTAAGLTTWWLVIYLDEVVPGDVLRPDNERRSYCCYFTFLPLCPFRQEAFWFPVAVLRNADVEKNTDGMPEIFSKILRGLLDSLASLVLGDTLVVCQEFFFLEMKMH